MKRAPRKRTKARPAPRAKRAPARRGAARPQAPGSAWPPPEGRAGPFDLLDTVRRILLAKDVAFLSRQVTCDMVAEEDLPKAWANPADVRAILDQLIEHLLRRSPRRGRISLEMGRFALRNGTGLELALSAADRFLDGTPEGSLLPSLVGGEPDPHSGVSLSDCREMACRQHGRVWADSQGRSSVTLHLLLPTSAEMAVPHPAGHRTFKYDIMIGNYSTVRKRFGIRKSNHLVLQIEHYVRSLVRFPMDMVFSAGDRGTITAIYEVEHGAGESIASRISHRLGREEFRIGRRPVDICFRYQLSAISPQRECEACRPQGKKRS
jgi:hypothetical protein